MTPACYDPQMGTDLTIHIEAPDGPAWRHLLELRPARHVDLQEFMGSIGTPGYPDDPSDATEADYRGFDYEPGYTQTFGRGYGAWPPVRRILRQLDELPDQEPPEGARAVWWFA